MKKNIFAVCDPEASYACNLTEYLNERKATPFEVQAFTSVESLETFTRENEIEILLISEQAFCSDIRDLPVNRTIILFEGEQQVSDFEYPMINKYQSSDEILSEVMEYFMKDHPEPGTLSLGSRKTKLYAVYSPVGRSRKTSFALALGEILAETKKVLYLNFEEYSGFEDLFQIKYRLDISDLIYFARQKDGGMIYRLNSVLQTFHELEYIPPVVSPADLRDVTAEEWIRFLNELISFQEYDVIILDLSEQVDDFFRILKECERIYMPVQDDMISQAKLKQYDNLVHMLEIDEIQKKTRRIHPPVQPLLRDGGNLTQQLVWGEMGNFVRRLLCREEEGDG